MLGRSEYYQSLFYTANICQLLLLLFFFASTSTSKQRHNKRWRSHSVGNLSENVLPVSQSPTQPGMPCIGQSEQNPILILPKASSEQTTEGKAKTRPKSWSPEMPPSECFGFKPICPSRDLARTLTMPNSDTGDLLRYTSWVWTLYFW